MLLLSPSLTTTNLAICTASATRLSLSRARDAPEVIYRIDDESVKSARQIAKRQAQGLSRNPLPRTKARPALRVPQ